uniref:Annexin n=1 Tax=Panagrolaimus sp. ES5 TaxID=591445 RepID=A0AC34G2M4_9BILA
METPVRFDAQQLHKAMAGLGTNENVLIEILVTRNNAQINELKQVYQEIFKQSLEKDIIGDTSGAFQRLLVSLCMGSRDESHHTDSLKANQDAWKLNRAEIFKQSLEKDIIGDTSGAFQRLLVSLCMGSRDESHHTDSLKANQDAWKLNRAGEQKLGTDEDVFNKIFATQNYSQLRLVFEEYEKVTKHSIEKAIEAEFSGSIKDGLLGIIKCIRNRN